MAAIAKRVYGEPGSLYARCGGVFGISAFVDRCMDLWMADTTLNDNPMVTRWHLSAQRPGFKFLVAQVRRARARTFRSCPTRAHQSTRVPHSAVDMQPHRRATKVHGSTDGRAD